MRSEGYRRLHQVCLDTAEQFKSPDARAGRLALAQSSLDHSLDADDVRPSGRHATQRADDCAPPQRSGPYT